MADNTVSAQWLGHATFLVTSPEGYRILIDPWINGNPVCPAGAKDLSNVDLILVTHGHGDHIADAVPIALQSGAPVIGVVELCHWVKSKGVHDTRGMNKGGTQVAGPVSVTMVHADHSCGITDGDQIVYGGEAVGYVVRFSNGYKVWHMGDTAVFGDMALIADIYRPDAVMMPIGDHYTMGVVEAARAVRLTGVKKIIPMHFGTFPMLQGTREELRSLCGDIDGLEIVELKPGDTVCL